MLSSPSRRILVLNVEEKRATVAVAVLLKTDVKTVEDLFVEVVETRITNDGVL